MVGRLERDDVGRRPGSSRSTRPSRSTGSDRTWRSVPPGQRVQDGRVLDRGVRDRRTPGRARPSSPRCTASVPDEVNDTSSRRTPSASATASRALSRISRALRAGPCRRRGSAYPWSSAASSASRAAGCSGSEDAVSRYTLRNYPYGGTHPGALRAARWARVSSVLGVGREGLFRGSAARRALGRTTRRSGCSWRAVAADDTEAGRLAMPDPASAQGRAHPDLWQGAWIAALVTGVVVWGLIFYVVIRFRRRSDDEIPVQTRYNLPLEIFYTIAPVVMVIVFFAHTVQHPEHRPRGRRPRRTTSSRSPASSGRGPSTTASATRTTPPTTTATTTSSPTTPTSTTAAPAPTSPSCGCPVDETTRFNLHSPDVIHDFGVPEFLMKMDVVPGRVNHYVITPDPDRRSQGQVLRALRGLPLADAVQVHVVSREDYEAHLQDLEDAGPDLRPPAARRRRGLHAGGPRVRNRGGTEVTATASHPSTVVGQRRQLGQQVVRVLTTTDHKVIGNLYLGHVVLLVPHRRPDGDADALRAGLPRPAGRQRRALQPALHDARHDHAAAVRDAAVLRLRQRDHAAADRLARRRVPAAQHVQLLALPHRRPDRRLRAS